MVTGSVKVAFVSLSQ